MPSLTIPHDLAAEESVLGCCLLKREACEPALEILTPGDFYRPLNGSIFAAIQDLYEHGEPIDAVTVVSKMADQGIADDSVGPLLVKFIGQVPTLTAVYQYAKAVERCKIARDVMKAAQQGLGDVAEGVDPFEVSDQLIRTLTSLGSSDITQKAVTVKELMEMEERGEGSPIIIPDLMRQNYRAIITGRPGAGKSTFTKMIGYCASQGLHPFSHREMEPIRVLSFDAENPDENIIAMMKTLHNTLGRASKDHDEERFKIVRQPGGMNLRSRRERTVFQREVAIHQPDLVVMGPAYKMGAKGLHGESWEDAAAEFLDVLDQMRTKYEFGLIVEAHTSKGEGIDPQGSAYFSQWPEVGLGLARHKENEMMIDVEEWRPNRIPGLGWPKSMVFDPVWLFAGTFV